MMILPPATDHTVTIPSHGDVPARLTAEQLTTIAQRLRVTEASDSRKRLMAAIRAYQPQQATVRPGER